MLDSILIAQSGLAGHQKGLKTISNNVANMNTVGFKSSAANFTDAYVADRAAGNALSSQPGFGGAGLDARTATLDFASGELRQTGNVLDAAIDGDGFFVLKDPDGNIAYTRDGQFQFDTKGMLVGRSNGMQVMARDAAGKLVPLDLSKLRTSPPKATTSVTLDGNLSSSATTHSIETLKVFDALGGEHTLKLSFTSEAATTPGLWSLAVLEGTTELAKGQVRFTGGIKDPATVSLKFDLSSNGGGSTSIELKLADSVTSFSTGTTSSLESKAQDGYGLGLLSNSALNAKGEVELTYSNAQKAIAGQIAVARFTATEPLREVGQAVFTSTGPEPEIRVAGDDLRIVTQTLEYANVDLTDQFSSLILMQRGYQAASQVLSTANDMIQELFDMKGRR